MTLQGRASTIRLMSVTLFRQQFSHEQSNRYRVFDVTLKVSINWRARMWCRCREWCPGCSSHRLYSAAIGRTLEDTNLSCGSGRPTWRCRAAGSGLVETTLAVEIVELIGQNAQVLFVYVCRRSSHGPTTSHVQGRLPGHGSEWRHRDEVRTDGDWQVDHGYTTSRHAWLGARSWARKEAVPTWRPLLLN